MYTRQTHLFQQWESLLYSPSLGTGDTVSGLCASPGSVLP
uniref:Uncharacterized protein n=1 Tax=Arundo donax TaxID=35708 RepID=A0A0A9HHQ3_ARUDO